MTLKIADEALDVLRRSLELAGLAPDGEGGVRLRSVKALGGGARIEVEFSDAASEGETVIDRDGVRIFVDPSVEALYPEALLTVEPQHEKLVVRPLLD